LFGSNTPSLRAHCGAETLKEKEGRAFAGGGEERGEQSWARFSSSPIATPEKKSEIGRRKKGEEGEGPPYDPSQRHIGQLSRRICRRCLGKGGREEEKKLYTWGRKKERGKKRRKEIERRGKKGREEEKRPIWRHGAARLTHFYSILPRCRVGWKGRISHKRRKRKEPAAFRLRLFHSEWGKGRQKGGGRGEG